jgi:glycosyltransferase involved in cell wall biosynthesis
VFFAGRFVERKGINDLLAAIPVVLALAPDTRFILAGGYDTGPRIEQAWLSDSLSAYRGRITFTGWLTPAQVAEWYRVADILVVPSWYEPFGLVILEGMLYGLPIAAAAVGGPLEILDPERTGVLFPPRNPEALAGALVRLITQPALRARIGQAAAHEVRRKWLWTYKVAEMRKIYAELSLRPGASDRRLP